ncbi:MAG: (2Fe-2S)-binding protein [Polyangiales bacterium]
MAALRLSVNGTTHDVVASPDTPLLYVLRNDLGLISAKSGCELEQCGACTILMDGEARMCCRLPVRDAIGCEIVTLEGLGTPAGLHPLQRAFLEENAAQCGYCTSGILMRAAGLLRRKATPTEAEIRRELVPNLCRCGSHNRVVRAIERAARDIARDEERRP